jgi:hypothetical protein
MDKPTPSTSVRHNDDLSKALIESYMTWMDGDTFQRSSVQEEGIPSLEKKGDLDDGTKKDPKANAGRPDPVGGVKQSYGAEIRDTTKVVAREETAKKESVSFELGGETYIFEVKMDGKDDNGNTSCWKGYKKQGTKKKGGKEVNNCVKAGFEPTGEEIKEKKLDAVNPKALKGDHAGRKDKDIDNDGDVDKSDKYLHNRRKTVNKIIAAKKKSAKK